MAPAYIGIAWVADRLASVSPAMATALASDEVAEDYKASLEDLAMNSRYEISNLTVIAKENTEHALAISRVLENHIRTVGSDQVSYHRRCYF